MTFQVFPNPQTAPLSISGFERGPAMTFAEHATGSPAVMTVRILRVDDPKNPAPDATDPQFLLGAGGAESVVPAAPASLSIVDANNTIVATASYTSEPANVFHLAVTIRHPGSTWTLQIQNQDQSTRQYTVAVADSDSDSRQPWMDAPATVLFEGNKGSTALLSHDVAVTNAGPGTLSAQPFGLTDPYLALPLDDIGPNAHGTLTIQFDPTKPGERQQTLTLIGNDTTAGASPGHNATITVAYQDIPPTPPALHRPCLFNDGCLQYRGRPNGNCTNAGCGHPDFQHDSSPT